MALTPLTRPDAILAADSATVALEGAAGALIGTLTDPFPMLAHERAISAQLNRLLSPALKSRLMQDIARRTGRPATVVQSADAHLIARWMVSLVPDQRWPGVILGAPSGAASHLSSLLGFPLLSQHVLCGVHGRYAADDTDAYVGQLAPTVRRILDRNPDFQAIIHHDPLHDRFLVRDLGFIRLKYRRVPLAFREFLQRALAPGAPVVILDCGYPWLQSAADAVHDRCQVQIGGLGAVDPERYLSDDAQLRDYRRSHGGTPQPWGMKGATPDWQPESEWGTLPSFRDDAVAFATELGLAPHVIPFDHPDELTTLVFQGFQRLWPESRRVYLDCFTHLCPAFNRFAQAVPLWLPFLGQDSYALAKRLLAGIPAAHEVLLSLHPSFADPEDLATIADWDRLLVGRPATWLGVDRSTYPTDLGAYGRYRPSLDSYLAENRLTEFNGDRLRLDYLELIQPAGRPLPHYVG